MIYSKHLAGAIAAIQIGLFFLIPLSGAQTKPPSGQAQGNAPAQITIKTQVRQVLLDVVVSDGKNRPITGLNREDFTVTEDGKPQDILSFEPHATTGQSTGERASARQLPDLPKNTFLNLTRAREDLPLNVLLYDVLNTPLSDQPFARREIVKFLKNKPPGSRYAIFILSDRLHLVQGVTDSEAELLAAMGSRATRSQFPPQGTPEPGAVAPSDALSDSGLVPNHPEALAMLDRLQHITAVSEEYLIRRRIILTVTAFEQIATFLRGLPGRKNLLWLSGSFPTGVLPGGDAIDPFSHNLDFSPELKETTNQLTLSQIAVYPVDIRGLMTRPSYGASNNRNYSMTTTPDQDARQSWTETSGEHDAMDQIAELSGGHAFYNSNGLQQALQSATEDGSNYYTLSYSPSNTNFDGKLRHIQVKVTHSGVHLAYRRTYFAENDSTLAHRASRAPIDRVDATMERGAPTEHELIFSLHAKPIGLPAALTPAQTKDLSQFSKFANLKNWDAVKMEQYQLDFALPQKELTYLITPDGVRHGSLEFLYAAFDGENELIYGCYSTGERTVLPEQAGQAHTGIYLARQLLQLPSNTAWLRIGIRDVADARIGSLEISLPLQPE